MILMNDDEEGRMLRLSKRQKLHISRVIRTKRKELFGYPGGNRDLAERIGVSPQFLSMWTYNKRTPTHRELLILAEVFDITLGELCDFDKRSNVGRAEPRPLQEFDAIQEDLRKNMLEICSITDQIVKRQRQMLTGKRDYRKHNEWLKRIKHYVDTI